MSRDWRGHGTVSNYQWKGCRCGLCVKAYNKYKRQKRMDRYKRLLEGQVVVEHGSNSTYHNWGCRCQPCKDTHAEICRKYRLGKKKKKRR